MKVVGLDHVQLAIPVGGEERARAFYREIMGLEEIPKPAETASRGGVWFRCGSLQLHLGIESNFRPAKKAHPALVLATTSALLLDRRTRHRAKRAEHAAVTRFRAQQHIAIRTFIIELASVRGHAFLLGKAAMRTGQHRFEDDSAHRECHFCMADG